MKKPRGRLRRYLQYTGLHRLFFVFFVVIFLGGNTVSLFLYAVFSSAMLSEINAATGKMLNNIKNSTEIFYDSAYSLLTYLTLGEPALKVMMFEKSRGTLEEIEGFKTMRNMLGSYPYIKYIAVYNGRLDKVFSTLAFTDKTGEKFKNIANEYFHKSRQYRIIPVLIEQHSFSKPTEADTITLLLYSPFSTEKEKGAVFLGIDCDYFEEMIDEHRSVNGQNGAQSLLILNSKGERINRITAELAELWDSHKKIYFEKMLSPGPDSPQFFTNKNAGVVTHLAYTKSAELDWVFIDIMPYNKMMARLILMRNMVFLITFGIMVVGFPVSYILALKLYRPMERKHDAVLSLLIKEQSQNSGGLLDDKIIESVFKSPFYTVVYVSLDEHERLEKLPAELQNEIREALAANVSDLLRRCCGNTEPDYSVVSPTDIAFILNLDDGQYPGGLVPLLKECIIQTQNNGWSLSIVIGSIVSSIFAVSDSFEKTRELLSERFFTGDSVFISPETVPHRGETAYPKRTEEQLFRAFLSGSEADIKDITAAFAAVLYESTYEYVYMHFTTLVLQLSSFCLAHPEFRVDADLFRNLIIKLKHTDTLKSCLCIFEEFCISLLCEFRSKNAVSSPFIKDAVALTEKCSADHTFSVNKVAEHLNITPEYFNRIFKKERGISFSEYLNEYRIEAARRLLTETNDDVRLIARKVGINNVPYFFQLFKKLYSVTPQQYRQQTRFTLAFFTVVTIDLFGNPL